MDGPGSDAATARHHHHGAARPGAGRADCDTDPTTLHCCLPSSVRSAPSLPLQFRRDLKTALHVSVIVFFTTIFHMSPRL